MLNKETSLYLDLIRFLAAFVVLIVHAFDIRLTGGFLWQLSGYGQTAVMVFFVMSGYVITYVVDNREKNAREYFLARAARLFSVIIPALILTLVLNQLGTYLVTEDYQGPWNANQPYYFWRYLITLFFSQGIWHGGLSPTNNGAFWSITFETVYYILFAIFVFVPKLSTRLVLLTLVALFAGPTILLLFPIWLMGVLVYKLHKCDHKIPDYIAVLIFFISFAIIIFSESYRNYFEYENQWLSRNNIVGDYIDGAMFALHLMCAPQVLKYIKTLLLFFEKPITFFASLTFCLYLFHLPIVRFLGVISPFDDVSSWQQIFYIYGVTMLIVVILGRPIERNKYLFKIYLKRYLKFIRIA
ncbi:acyltransferase family protein [Flavobacterium sp. W21_SRS_FM6]|uniref:acyltransferase family protein n=1 Tax=Flavobacterium sp. W21_SRS_FM6 TaxID=3240268 RepID=UPI003F8DA934